MLSIRVSHYTMYCLRNEQEVKRPNCMVSLSSISPSQISSYIASSRSNAAKPFIPTYILSLHGAIVPLLWYLLSSMTPIYIIISAIFHMHQRLSLHSSTPSFSSVSIGRVDKVVLTDLDSTPIQSGSLPQTNLPSSSKCTDTHGLLYQIASGALQITR
jgi:hypothetical protein